MVVLYNKCVGKIIIPWMNAAVLTTIVLAQPFIWLIIKLLKMLIPAINQIMLLLIKLENGNTLNIWKQ